MKANHPIDPASRRQFLKACAVGAGGAIVLTKAAPEALACMECLTAKLDGRFPIGKTIIAGNTVIPADFPQGGERQAPATAVAGPTDPMKYLRAFDYGVPGGSSASGGRPVREYSLRAEDVELEVAGGIKYPAWTYNGFLPGPTLRATAGDRLLIHFENRGSKPHTIHFHGVHPANMDGVFEVVPPGKNFTYDFIAEPFGVFPYHCHMMPLRKHISRGLFGTLIVDPPTPRPPATEMIMVMHGLDVNFDMENEFYAVNGVANYYAEHPINIAVGEHVRVYLSNMTEFDLVNNFHLHANLFDYYPNGTSLVPTEHTDTVNLCQGQRGILEFSYKYPGMYMFHAHTSEFAELGWMGFFNVRSSVT
ncbi:MAG: multicopper oxidase domain-containing protein [Tepidisphaeraceae bacterium]